MKPGATDPVSIYQNKRVRIIFRLSVKPILPASCNLRRNSLDNVVEEMRALEKMAH